MATLNFNWVINGAGTSISTTLSKTGTAEQHIDEAIADAVTDGLIIFTVDISEIEGFYMTCDQALTVKTNDSGSPQETITLAADTPVVWRRGDAGETSPFAGDVTKLYVSNASGSTANLKIRTVSDATP